MRTYFPPQLLNPAQQTGRWAVRDIDDDQVLYTTNLGSYLRCRITGSHQLTLTVANHLTLAPARSTRSGSTATSGGVSPLGREKLWCPSRRHRTSSK